MTNLIEKIKNEKIEELIKDENIWEKIEKITKEWEEAKTVSDYVTFREDEIKQRKEKMEEARKILTSRLFDEYGGSFLVDLSSGKSINPIIIDGKVEKFGEDKLFFPNRDVYFCIGGEKTESTPNVTTWGHLSRGDLYSNIKKNESLEFGKRAGTSRKLYNISLWETALTSHIFKIYWVTIKQGSPLILDREVVEEEEEISFFESKEKEVKIKII